MLGVVTIVAACCFTLFACALMCWTVEGRTTRRLSEAEKTVSVTSRVQALVIKRAEDRIGAQIARVDGLAAALHVEVDDAIGQITGQLALAGMGVTLGRDPPTKPENEEGPITERSPGPPQSGRQIRRSER